MTDENRKDQPELEPFVECPHTLGEQSIEVQQAIANHPNTPRALLEILINSDNDQIAEAARLHVNWAGEWVSTALGDWHTEVDRILQTAPLGQNDRLAVELLELGPVPPACFSEWIPAAVWTKALKNPHIPLRYRIQMLERLAQEPTLEPRLQVAESPETPIAVLEQLVGDIELPVRLATQANPHCPPGLVETVNGDYEQAADWDTDGDELARLGQSRWGWVRLAVAQNPSTPEAMLAILAQDSQAAIPLAVVKNPVTSASILAGLMEVRELQEAIAIHPNATTELLLQLVSKYRYKIWARKNLPTAVLEFLYEEALGPKPPEPLRELHDAFIRQHETPEYILAALSKWDIDILEAETRARNPTATDHDIQERTVDRMRYRIDIVKHPNVSVRILEILARCPNPWVQLAVAQHDITPSVLRLEVQTELSNHPNQDVVVQIAHDSRTPPAILESMANNATFESRLLQETHQALIQAEAGRMRDCWIDSIYREVLIPTGLSLDTERWLKLAASPDLLVTLQMASTSHSSQPRSALSAAWSDRLAFQFAEILPDLDESRLKFLGKYFYDMLNSISQNLQNEIYHRQVAIALMGNPNTPADDREGLRAELERSPNVQRNSDQEFLSALLHNPLTPEDERRRCLETLLSSEYGRYQLARDPRTPVEILEQLWENSNPQDRAGYTLQEDLAKNPATPDDLLERMVDSQQNFLWRAIATYARPSGTLLARMLAEQTDNKIVRRTSIANDVLRNPNCPAIERYRFQLAQDRVAIEQNANKILARRPNSPYALAQVVEKGDQNAKISAARNIQTPIAILEQLAQDPDETVRIVVLDNRQLPIAIQVMMTRGYWFSLINR